MILDVYVENQPIRVEIPEIMLTEGEEFYAKMDKDMDGGWKMGPTYVENPDQIMRAQIAASRMLSAIDNENRTLMQLMAGYIVSRVPGVKAVKIDTQGELLNTEIIT